MLHNGNETNICALNISQTIIKRVSHFPATHPLCMSPQLEFVNISLNVRETTLNNKIETVRSFKSPGEETFWRQPNGSFCMPVTKLFYFLLRCKIVHVITFHLKYFVFNVNQGQAQRERYFVALLLMHFNYYYQVRTRAQIKANRLSYDKATLIYFALICPLPVHTSGSNFKVHRYLLVIHNNNKIVQSRVTSFIVQVCMDF